MKTLVLAASFATLAAASFTSSTASARDGRFFNQSPSRTYQSYPYRPHWGPGASHGPGNRGCHWVNTPQGPIRICR